MISPVSIPAILMTGVLACICMHNVLAYLRLRERREHLAFAVTCLFAALYAAATAGLYSAEKSLDGQFWQRLQVTVIIYAAIAFVWFIWLYTGQMSTFVRNTFSVYYALSSVILWFDRSGFSWPADRPSVKHIDLPFGYQVVYQEMSPGPFVEITSAIGLVFLAYILRACLRFYRSGEKDKGRVLLWAISLFVFGVANDMAVTVGMYKFIYLIEYAYFGMILLIDNALTRETLEAARLRHGRMAEESRYKRMFEHMLDVHFELTPDGRILDVSPSLQRVTGLSREEVVGHVADEFYVKPEQRAELRRRIQETGRVDDFDMSLRLGNGRVGDFAITATIVAGEGDAPVRVVGSLRDVTKRRQAEISVARAARLHEQLRNLAQDMDEADSLGAGLGAALRKALDLCGCEAGAAYAIEAGTPILHARQNMAYETAKAFEKLPVEDDEMRAVLATGRPFTLGSLPWDFLATFAIKDCQGAWVLPCVAGDKAVGYLVLAPLKPGENREAFQPAAAVATEAGAFIARRLYIEMARRREEQYQRAQRFAQVGSWEYDVLDGELRGSRETGRIFGLREKVQALSLAALSNIIHPADRDRIMGAFGDFVSGKVATYDVEYRVIRQSDGVVRTVHSVAEAVEDDAGRLTKVLGTVQDITERKHLQQQLLLAQRMESVGLLAGGIAHDFNNLLSVILSYSDLALSGMDSADPKYAMVHGIGQAADRARHLTQQLLAFSRRQVMEMRVIDLNGVLREMAPMLRRLIGEGIVLETHLDETVPAVTADPAQIQQIMMNLAVNARDAMPDGGTLTITTESVTIKSTKTGPPSPSPSPGDYTVITVSDSGCGMPAEVLDHVFDPFFTTKEVGAGTGLGLATVYGIVKQHGGFIWADSTPGEGARFRIYLPAVEGAPEAQPQGDLPRESTRGTETILVVEDEEMVRELTSSVLRRHGYEVLTAQDGEDALDVAEHFGQSIDLLLTDVVMPRMNGRELYEQLAPREPGMKVLFMSGYANELVSDCSNLGPEPMLLQKPFTVQSLTESVRTILDG